MKILPLITPTAKGELSGFYAIDPACPVWSRANNMGPFKKLAGKRVCAHLIVGHDWRRRYKGWTVRFIESYGTRGSRAGTRLYEHAARLSCDLVGGPLASDDDGNRSTSAEAFWKKQVAKGRAEKIEHRYALTCPAPKSLEGLRRRRR